MYTRVDFGHALKEKLQENIDLAEIGRWAYSIYLEHINYINTSDNILGSILLTLNHMEDGPEFELNLERLYEIAEDLIQGKKEINMSYE